MKNIINDKITDQKIDIKDGILSDDELDSAAGGALDYRVEQLKSVKSTQKNSFLNKKLNSVDSLQKN